MHSTVLLAAYGRGRRYCWPPRHRRFLIEPAADPADAGGLPASCDPGVRRPSRGCSRPVTTDDHDDDPRTVVSGGPDAGRHRARRRAARPGRRPARTWAGGTAAGWWSIRTARRGRAARRWSGPPARTPSRPGCCGSRPPCRRATRCFFRRLGWQRVRPITVAGRPHVLMRWPIGRIAALAAATKLAGRAAGRAGCSRWTGSGRARVSSATTGRRFPARDVIAACDAIVPSMVERDPEWAGWCSVLVNVNDLAAMGAARLGCSTRSGRGTPRSPAAHPGRAAAGRRRVRRAGARRPHPARGARRAVGDRAGPHGATRSAAVVAARATGIRLTADLGGGWRPGYRGPPVGLDLAPGGPRSCGRCSARWRPPGPPPPRTCRWPGSPARSACWPRRAVAAAVLDVAAVPSARRGHRRATG